MPALAIVGLLSLIPGATAYLGITAMSFFWAAMSDLMMAVSYFGFKGPKQLKFDGGGALDNFQSPEETLPVVYGRTRVGGNRVYTNSTGENNKFLHIVLTLSEGPIEGIEALYLDDKPISEYGSLAYYEFFNGDGNQGICTTLQSQDSRWNDYMRYTAYVYVRLEFNPEKFSGTPKITAVIKGRKLYDPRTGNTAYSNNPALVWYDLMTSKRYGLGISSVHIDTTTVIDAANWCDTQAHPYTFNGSVGDRAAFLDNMLSVLSNFRGDIVWSEGKYKLLIRKSETPVMSLDENEIVADSFTFSIPGLADTPNRIIVKYPDEANTGVAWTATTLYDIGDRVTPVTSNGRYYECIDAGTSGSSQPSWPESVETNVSDGSVVWKCYVADLGWVVKSQTVEDNAAVLLYDLEERDIEMSLIGTTNAEQANLLAVYHLERARLNKVFTFSAHPRTLALEPGDVISLTHSLPGWVDRAVRIIDIRLSQDGLVGLTVQEEDPALYDDTLNLSPHTYFSTNLPDPLALVPEATGISFNEEEYFNKAVSYTRLRVSFTGPTSPFWSHSEVWVDIENELGTRAGYNHYTNARGMFTIEPIQEGYFRYHIKLLSVSIQDRKALIAQATEFSYPAVGQWLGKNTPPDDVTVFKCIPLSDTVILQWDAVNNVDLSGYEIRKGTSWIGGIFIGFTRAISFHLNGVPPGTHSYMIKSVDTNGKYSNGYALATSTVYGPASYTSKMSEYNDFGSFPSWIPDAAYSLSTKVLPPTPNGYYYKCIVAGVSGPSQPTWATQTGTNTTDNTVTWKCYQHHEHIRTEKYDDPGAGIELRVIHDSDEFNKTQDLKTGGDGTKLAGWNVLNSASADAIDMNVTSVDVLTIDCNATATNLFSGPYVYKEFTGDFDVETYISSINSDADFEYAGLMVYDPAASAGDDSVAIRRGFNSGLGGNVVYATSHVNSVAVGLDSAVGTDSYLRITRVGQVFTLYSKAAPGVAWTQRAQYTRVVPNAFASTVRVGLAAHTNNTSNTLVAQFEYFRKTNGNLTGTYRSPVYDRDSIVTRRSWLAYDYLFEGTGAAWYDHFISSDLWTDKFVSTDTWLHRFSSASAGNIKMQFGISNDGVNWSWTGNFESFAVELQGRYVRYEVNITDLDAGGYLHCKAPTLKEAYWV